jgi:MFS family permease
MTLLPPSATTDAKRVVAARAVRAFADGAVSVLLASYLSNLGLSPFQIGAVVTGTLLGSAALTLAVGLWFGATSRRKVLLLATLLMIATGAGFLVATSFWPLLVVGAVGTLNPSGGDVSVFLPTEQAVLSDTVAARERTALFARYNVLANFTGAFGALASGLPGVAHRAFDVSLLGAQRTAFAVYALVALVAGFLYRGLTPAADGPVVPNAGGAPLQKSRGVVVRLALIFCLDSAGGGFVVQALLALWLFRRFGLSVETAGAVFFGAGLLAGLSQLASPRLAARVGLVRTMVFTHVPANLLLMAAALMPTAPLAIAFLLARMSLSQMDVPARQAFVMSVVPPEERSAAASVTNVPRSLASGLTPLASGYLLGVTTFGWPLLMGGAAKLVYDLLLLWMFQSHPVEGEPARAVDR